RRLARAPLRDLEHERLGPIDRSGHVVGHVVPEVGDVTGDADQPPQQRVLLDDAGVAGGVGDRRRARLQPDERLVAADRLAGPGRPLTAGAARPRSTGPCAPYPRGRPCEPATVQVGEMPVDPWWIVGQLSPGRGGSNISSILPTFGHDLQGDDELHVGVELY